MNAQQYQRNQYITEKLLTIYLNSFSCCWLPDLRNHAKSCQFCMLIFFLVFIFSRGYASGGFGFLLHCCIVFWL